MPGKDRPVNFFALQRTQRRKSLLLLVPLFACYYLGFLFLSGLVVLCVSVFTVGGVKFALSGTFLAWNLIFALLIALIHYHDARTRGAEFIRARLEAKPPEPDDRYHRQLVNLVEEMRLAAGLPRVQCYVLSSFAINSAALSEADGSPSILISEGMLAECTREELQAAVAHELAHILRGDTFYVTLVCSLANLFERIRILFEPGDSLSGRGGAGENESPGALFAVAAALPETALRLLSMGLSRQRELLADATAVELTRNPMALAQVVYKAHVQRSFIGDFSSTYAPLFIVPPESEGMQVREGFFARLFASHPPVMQRVDRLAEWAGKCRAQVIERIWRQRAERDQARVLMDSAETTLADSPLHQDNAVWEWLGADGQWLGPYPLLQLLLLPGFAPGIPVRNQENNQEGPAHTFPRIAKALGFAASAASSKRGSGKCPRCDIPLAEIHYEGVPIEACPRCRGKLVETGGVARIVARKEVRFSEAILQEARRRREKFFHTGQRKSEGTASHEAFPCPRCGSKMLPRPYSYNYFIPVEKCLACRRIWFDADELEILQAMIEETRG